MTRVRRSDVSCMRLQALPRCLFANSSRETIGAVAKAQTHACSEGVEIAELQKLEARCVTLQRENKEVMDELVLTKV